MTLGGQQAEGEQHGAEAECKHTDTRGRRQWACRVRPHVREGVNHSLWRAQTDDQNERQAPV